MNPFVIGSKIIHLDTTESTNKYAFDLLKQKNIQEGTVIATSEQTGGKGRGDNLWNSEKNKNLLFTLILHPEFLPIEKQFYISKAIALGIADFVSQYHNNVRIKWPNDIYVENNKICGILIENSIMGSSISDCVVGIGININQDKFDAEIPNATSLKLLTNINFELTESLSQLLQFLDQRYSQLKKKLYSNLNTDYLTILYKYNNTANFESSGKAFQGCIINVEESGLLVLKTETNQILKFALDEIKFL